MSGAPRVHHLYNNMVYKMIFYIDGGCENNGYRNSHGSAAACLRFRSGSSKKFSTYLPFGAIPPPTSQRAELTAVILALQAVLDRNSRLRTAPRLDVTIHADSKYTIGCLTTWLKK